MADRLAVVLNPHHARRDDGAVDPGDRSEQRQADHEDADHGGADNDRPLDATVHGSVERNQVLLAKGRRLVGLGGFEIQFHRPASITRGVAG